MSKVIEDELYEMVNLSGGQQPADDCLGRARGNARHDVRVKVNMAHGNRMSIANTAVVAVRPAPRLSPDGCPRLICKPSVSGCG
jgi:hypothetical protein